MIRDLIKKLEEDKDYYYAWKANIAMSFYDEYNRNEKKYKNKIDIHNISNKAADNFLKALIGGKKK